MDYLQSGIEVSYSEKGETKSEIIYIVDYNNVNNNSFIVANQWTFIEKSNKRPDILLFLNGLPICLFELKSPSREQTDASEADSMGVPAASGGRAIREFACKLVTRMATPFLRVPLSLHCLKATAVPPLLSLTLFY